MTDARPRVVVSSRDLVLQQQTDFTLRLAGVQSPDTAVVIDIYDLDNPVHPAGHVGWWKFAAPRATEDALVQLRDASGAWSVTLDGAIALDSWRNDTFTPVPRLLINVVLRSNATNAIVHLERIVAGETTRDLAELRNRIDRNWASPELCPAPYVFDPDETIHLVAHDIALHDAVGNLCIGVYRLLVQNGIPARLYATNCDPAINDIVHAQAGLPDQIRPGDQILYFYSTFDADLPAILAAGCRKCLYLHGVTEPNKLRVFDPELAMVVGQARAALPQLNGFDRLAANSLATARQLAAAIACELDQILTIPPALGRTNPAPERRGESAGTKLLVVGQLSPHKKVEDALRLLAALRRHDPTATCTIVGRPRSRAYRDYLEWVQRDELGLPSDAVSWAGVVDDATLSRFYATSSALVSMSEDEGFCLPVLEAMRHGMPVFAYAVPAVLETLGEAGVSFRTKDVTHLAAVLHDLLQDTGRLARLVENGRRRAAGLTDTMLGQGFFELLRRS